MVVASSSSFVARGVPIPRQSPPAESQRSSLSGPITASSPSSSPHPPREEDAAVCCMCGDRGLPRELFRCKSCRARLQHGYCSNLYPLAAASRRCNWCLVREPVPAQAASHAAAASPPTKRKAASGSYEDPTRNNGCSWRRPPAKLGYPVKKKRKTGGGDESPRDAGVKKAGTCGSNAGEGSKEVMRARDARRVRVKVQRYKLLAEVISC